MKGFIYKYTFADGKVYIGQTRRPMEIRHREHLQPSTGPLNPSFWEAYQELGEPTLEVLEKFDIDDEDQLVAVLNYWETEYIRLFNASDPNFGYNIKTHGMATSGNSALLRKEVQERFNECSRVELALYKSATNKIFNTHKPLSEEEKELIRQILSDGESLVSDDLSEYFNFDDLSANDENLLFWVEEKLGFYESCKESDIQDEIESDVYRNAEYVIRKRKTSKPIVQMDMDGNIIREFESRKAVVNELGHAKACNIDNALKGRSKTAYGFRWAYKE